MRQDRIATVFRLAAEAASAARQFGIRDRETLIEWVIETGHEQRVTRGEAIESLTLTAEQVGLRSDDCDA